MCCIFGAKVNRCSDIDQLAKKITRMAISGEDRGRDGTGVIIIHPTPTPRVDVFRSPERASICEESLYAFLATHLSENCIVVGNNRYQPLQQPDSVNELARQPIYVDGVILTHNGTFPEDDLLQEKFHLKNETGIDSEVLARLYRHYQTFGQRLQTSVKMSISTIQHLLHEVAGGFACALVDSRSPGTLHLFRNFKPLTLAWVHSDEDEEDPDLKVNDYLLYNSEAKNIEVADGRRDWLDPHIRWFDMPAYSGFSLDGGGVEHYWKLENKILASLPARSSKRSLVICSGGLDSSLAAFVSAKLEGNEVTLLHMDYGQRAVEREKEAVNVVAEELQCKAVFVDASYIGKWHSTSPLIKNGDEIPQGFRSSESTLCWTAARNMVFLTLAAAFAEGQGYSSIYSGFNLEESGSYSDNTIEFFKRFDAFAEFGTQTRVTSRLSIARLMKTDNIRLAHHLKVPMQATWSCDTSGVFVKDRYPNNEFYENSVKSLDFYVNAEWNKDHDREKVNHQRAHIPCGTCGCCHTRRIAYKRAGLLDPQLYAAPLKDLPPWWNDAIKPSPYSIEELVMEVQKVR